MIGIAGAVGMNALLLAALLTMHGNSGIPAEEDPGFAAIVTADLDPPPPPEPDAVEEGASAEPSRGETAEPSRPEPERPLPVPLPPVRIAGALTDADYRRIRPPEGAGGTVGIAFRVRTDGRIEGCRVERSSGWQVLDAATCRLVTERFRFRPARDAAGRIIPWSLKTDFTWVPR